MTQSLLDEQLFFRFQKLIHDTSGILLSTDKRAMLQVRLGRRLRALEFDSFEQYDNYLSDPATFQHELQDLINAVTTNKTDFYRESHHFDYLRNELMPQLTHRQSFSSTTPCRVWSAGCSTGEEPYTIAMELAEQFGTDAMRFGILATDISTKVLKTAMRGVYDSQITAPIPAVLKRKYLLQGKGARAGYYKVAPELRKTVQFGRLNFTDDDYRIPSSQHIIFCRNVLIYFNETTRNEILEKICNYLLPGGTLFIGHSESLDPGKFGLNKVLPTIYTKPR